MDSLFGMLILFGITALGVGFIWKSIDNRFPKVKIDVRDRGLRYIKIFRLRGNSIVPDDLIGILMNTFKYWGDISTLEYHTQPNGSRIYDAVIRHDFLIGIKYTNKNPDELEATKPTIWLDHSAVVEIPKKEINSNVNGKFMFADGVLVPMKLQYSNENITEKTIKSGKDIAIGFIEEERKAKAFTQASNPVMAVLISSIPLLIMGALICLMIYFSMSTLSDNVVKMLQAADKIYAAIPK